MSKEQNHTKPNDHNKHQTSTNPLIKQKERHNLEDLINKEELQIRTKFTELIHNLTNLR